MIPLLPRVKPPSGPPQLLECSAAGYRLRCLPPYSRFRGIEIPWDDPEWLEKSTEELVKQSRSRKVVRLSAGQYGAPLDLYVKRYNFKTWYGPYLRWVRKSRAREEFEMGWRLMAAGIRTPRPVWLAESANRPSRFSLLATEAIPEAENALTRWRRLADCEAARLDLIRAVGRFLFQLHAQGFYHDDCKAGHMLVPPHKPSKPGHFHVIDLLGCTLDREVGRTQRARNLYQILRSFCPRDRDEGFRDEHRWAFLEAYCGSTAEARRWAASIRKIGRYKGRVI